MSSGTPEQGLVKEDDNKDYEIEEVEDKDMEDQDDNANHNVNINCNKNDDDIDCNNKTQKKVKNEVIVNNNYKKIEVIEECNDENKSVKDDLNQDNVEEQNPENVAKNEEMNVLPVIVTRCSRISTSKGSLS